jgi:hypothetical protein
MSALQKLRRRLNSTTEMPSICAAAVSSPLQDVRASAIQILATSSTAAVKMSARGAEPTRTQAIPELSIPSYAVDLINEHLRSKSVLLCIWNVDDRRAN